MQFIEPKNLKEALKLKAKTGYPIIAGGTDLMVQWRSGLPKPLGVINIWGLAGLNQIKKLGNKIEIGTLATHSEIVENKMIQEYLPALVQACETVGARQIQNRGTIGGNVMNASPAGDTLPVLLACDAGVELVNINGKRIVPFSKFYTGYRKTVVKGDEIVTKFIFNIKQKDEYAQFMKIGTRKAQAISKICGCFVVVKYPKGLISNIRIAYGSVAPIPIRCPKTEDFLKGKKSDSQIIEEATKLVSNEVTPIDDIRSMANYRRYICGILLKRFLKNF